MSQSVRLNKWLALQLGVSRREADELIAKGKIYINDSTATLGAQIIPDTDIIKKGTTPVTAKATLRYVALNKPIGYVCSRKRQGDSPTIYELLPDGYHDLKPVGRLDKNSSGLILLTNDGDFAHQMTHPSFHKVKIYEVTLDKPLEPLHQQMISDYGIMLEDGKSKFMIEKITSTPLIDSSGETSAAPLPSPVAQTRDGNGKVKIQYLITMSEGRNRQIRRTFAALGYTVVALNRTQFGNYTTRNLKIGEFRITEPR